MADGVWKGVQTQVIGHFEPLSLNKFFDPSTPSMRKIDDGEKEKERKKYRKAEYVQRGVYAANLQLLYHAGKNQD